MTYTHPWRFVCSVGVNAMDLAQQHNSVVIVGEDVDLLVIMIGRCRGVHANVYFLKPGKGTVSPLIFSPDCQPDQSISDNILFLHAMGGCDTTSASFKVGKMRFLRTLKKNSALTKTIEIFKDPTAHADDLTNAGLTFFIALYKLTNKEVTSLNKLRYKCYLRSAYRTTAHLASLPPTEAAAQQHSLRVYFQVQQWLGNENDPEQWGWKKTKSGLQPVPTLQPPAPEAVLKLISCKCMKTCQTNCGCKKAGLNCSNMCLNCENSCNNMPVAEIEEEAEDDPEFSELLKGNYEILTFISSLTIYLYVQNMFRNRYCFHICSKHCQVFGIKSLIICFRRRRTGRLPCRNYGTRV